MAANFLELATTLTYLGGNWQREKIVNFMPCKSEIFAEGTIVQVHFWLEAQTLARNNEGKEKEVKTEPERETDIGYKVVSQGSKFQTSLAW